MKLKAGEGKLPNIFWMDASMAVEFAKNNYVADLSDYLKVNADISSTIDKSAQEAFNNGKIQYGLPYQSNVEGFFYNKSIFKKNGISEPVNGTTFDQFIDMINKLNKAGVTPIAQGSKNSGFATWGYYTMLDRLIRIGVNAVEQLSKWLPIEDKFNEAKKRIIAMLNEKGIYISEDELDNSIESVVSEFNKYKSKKKIPEEDIEGAEVSDIE